MSTCSQTQSRPSSASISAESKEAFNLRFRFLKSRHPGRDVNSIAAECLRWLSLAIERWASAPLKRGDVDALLARCNSAGTYSEAIRLVGSVFSDPGKLGKCFPLPSIEIATMENEDDDLNTFDWKEADRVVPLLIASSKGVANSMGYAIRGLATEMSATAFAMARNDGRLRALRIAMMAENLEGITRAQVLKSFSQAPRERKEYMARFLLHSWGIGRSVQWLNSVVAFALESEKVGFSFEHVQGVMQVLAILYQLNKDLPPAEQLQAPAFVNQEISQLAAHSEGFLNRDFILWMNSDIQAPPQSFTACPFILDTASKAHVLQLASEVEQRERFRHAAGQGEIPFLVLKVRRDRLVDDTMHQLARCAPQDFRKPLKVQFAGEDGVDAGGLRKEYFLLMMRQLLDSSFGMFRECDPSTKLLWFNPDSLENQLQFELVGVLIGLAITNRVIVDVPLPRVLYKLLLSDESFRGSTLEDLKELDPSLAHGLESLLAFGGDVESVFCRTFQASRESWGEVKTFDLIPNGSNVPVTNDNRSQYVDAYVNWFLVESIKPQLLAFRKGFFSVMDQKLLRDLLMRPEELELLVVGVRTLDFKALQEAARYDDGYEETSRTVVAFWNVAHALSDVDKRTLLKFVTGSDRVPIRGLGDVRIVISRAGSDVERLPSAHTCFDHLLLPDYGDEDLLKSKLKIALQHAEGFFTR